MASSRALTRTTVSTQFFNLLRGSNHSRAMSSPFTTRSTDNESRNDFHFQGKEVDNPFQISGPKGSNTTKVDSEEGGHVRVDMPGVGKNVQVWVEQDHVYFKGRATRESEHEESEVRAYGGNALMLPVGFFKNEDVKAVMKDGVLRLFIPRKKGY